MKRLGLTSTAYVCAVLLGLSLVPAWLAPEKQGNLVAEAFTARNLAHGSEGDDVNELQHRLHFLGFYTGKIDGIFGWRTYWSVRNFQYEFGLKVNGFVDMKTKMKLAAATKNWHPSKHSGSSGSSSGSSGSRSSSPQAQGSKMPTVPGLSQSDLRLMARVVYGEARGEPERGEVAIAAVILNRLTDPRFPHTVSAIVYQPGAFTAVADGQVNLQPDTKAGKAVQQAIHGMDPSHGAVYYFDPATATNKWIWSRPQIVTIGHHIFCR